MSSSSQGLSPSEDLSTTNNHSDPTFTETKVDINTNNKSSIRCYMTSNITNTKCTQNTLSTNFTLPQQPNTTPTQQPLVVPTLPLPQTRPGRRFRTHSLAQYLKKSNIEPILQSPLSQSVPVPGPLQPPTAQPYTGPNPYKKKTTAPPVLQAISQFSHEDDHQSIPSTNQSSDSNYVTSTNPIRYHSTRTRTIRAPDRFGFAKPTSQPPKQVDDVSFAPPSLQSPMTDSEPYCYNNDVDISSFVLKELEEISVMTKSLNEMMNTTEQLILSLQNDTRSSHVTAPPQIPEFVHTGNSTESSNTEVTPNNEPKALSQATSSSENDSLLSPTSAGLPYSDDFGTINSDTSITTISRATRQEQHINEITPGLFDSLLDDIQYKNEGDYRIVMQNTNGIKEFHESDPDYYPTMRAIQKSGADHICLVETNTP